MISHHEKLLFERERYRLLLLLSQTCDRDSCEMLEGQIDWFKEVLEKEE